MNRFQDAIGRLLKQPQPQETAAAKAADRVCEEVAGTSIPKSKAGLADGVVHYLTGAMLGGLYGLARSAVPAVGLARGSAFGLAAWICGDNIAVPLLRLGPPAAKCSLRDQSAAAAAHAVFGLTTEAVRQAFGRLARLARR
jgi:uncharacterized membrane protein YagU involved in acid resistance